jgi:RNA polymerase sigma-70 factor (ECF subfamily)
VVSLETVGEHAAIESAAGPGPESQVVAGEEVEALKEALQLLSEREREIIRLRFVAGITNRAIAKMMGLREGNVAVILFRALRKLRKTLGAAGYGDEIAVP